uniref:ATP synthase complex subunit 8 n=1 Tax=Entiminae sp. ACP-2013 TaxID=2480628 RepID=A0A3G5FNY0_9CUCU|nr:ATP synthase F0 subunit 8 [Entiminae sp. ACP-2013]
MPQMAPINWISLYFLFLLMFMIFLTLNYYSFSYKPKMMKLTKSNINLYWKW